MSYPRHRWPSLVSLVLGLVACTATEGPEPSESVASAIMAGAVTAGDPNVVLLDLGGPTCTGTLVHKRAVLTAAHCLAHTPEEIRVHIISPGRRIEVGARPFAVHPGFDQESLENDLALLVLDEAVDGVQPAHLHDGKSLALASGLTLRIAGFGSDPATPSSQGPRVKRSGTAEIDAAEERTLRLRPRPAQVCDGDSGGPSFVKVDGIEYLAGVTSTGDAECNGTSVVVRVDAYLSDFLAPLLRQVEAGEPPHAGAPLGAACVDDGACSSLICAGPEEAEKVCSTPCVDLDDTSCGAGRGCAFTGRDRVPYACSTAVGPPLPAKPMTEVIHSGDEQGTTASASCSLSPAGSREGTTLPTSPLYLLAFAAIMRIRKQN